MARLRKILLLCVLALMPTVADAMRDSDFIARMMEQVEADTLLYAPSDYRQITVSPTMIQSVIEMMASGALTGQGVPRHNQEVMAKLLLNVKSLRIFAANGNAGLYTDLARNVIAENKRDYKKFKSSETKGTPSAGNIYTRKSGREVVEIILLSEAGQEGKLQILNLTGNFTADFINLLVQMNN